MISASDLHALRGSLPPWEKPGLPISFATDCARVLGVSDITISFTGDSDQVLLWSSSDDARSVGEWEFTLEEGPGFDAAMTGASGSADTAPSPTNPWPRLCAKARAMGYQSIAGVAWRVEGSAFATLNLQDRHGIITSETLADAEHIAGELTSRVVGFLRQQPSSLDQRSTHATFHQATGMVMADMGIDAGSAGDVLRAHAWAQDRLLMEVAADVVACTLTFPPSEPSPNRAVEMDGPEPR